MTPLLKRLDTWLKANHADLRADLKNGLTPGRIKSLGVETGIDIPQDLADLLRWKNGQKGEFALSPDGVLLGDAGITEHWSRWMELEFAGRFPSSDWFHPGWLPFLAKGEVYLCVDTAGTYDGTPGQIIEFHPDEARRVLRYASLERWLETVVVALEDGLLSPKGSLVSVTAPERFQALYERLNPGLPVSVAAGSEPKPAFHKLLEAIRDKDLPGVLAALDEGAEVNRTGPDGRPPLVTAAIAGDPEIVKILIAREAEIDWEDWTDGRRAIHWAAEYGPDCVPLLIAAGADVNAPLQYSALTPLMLAAWKGNTDAVKALLAAGANPTRKSSLGETALSKADGAATKRVIREALGK